MAADFIIGQLDTAPVLTTALTYSDGSAVDLTGASVNFVMRALSSTTAAINAAATIVGSASDGNVSFTFTSAQTAVAGIFMARYAVTFESGSVMQFPTDGYMEIQVEADLTTVTDSPTLVSLGEVKSYLNIQPTDRSHDAKLLSFLYAAAVAIEDITGPIVPKVFDEWYDGGQYHIVFRHRPVIQLLACSFYIGPVEYQASIEPNPAAGTIYSVMMDEAAPNGRRLVRRGPGGGVIPFPNNLQSVHVVYKAGRVPTPPNVYEATLELIRENYQPTQQAGPAWGAQDQPQGTNPAYPVLSPRVRSMLTPMRRYPRIA